MRQCVAWIPRQMRYGLAVCVVSGRNTLACMHHNFILSLLVFPQMLAWPPPHNTIPIAGNRGAYFMNLLSLISVSAHCENIKLCVDCKIQLNSPICVQCFKWLSNEKYANSITSELSYSRWTANVHYRQTVSVSLSRAKTSNYSSRSFAVFVNWFIFHCSEARRMHRCAKSLGDTKFKYTVSKSRRRPDSITTNTLNCN